MDGSQTGRQPNDGTTSEVRVASKIAVPFSVPLTTVTSGTPR
jgi:hypothetical protein